MKRETKAKHFIEKPVYPGGGSAMKKFIHQNLKYPKQAIEEKIEGLVIVRYDIDYKGKVTSTKVISSLGYGCDEEAERVIKLLKFQVPKTPRKLKVVYHRTTRIHFRLPKEKPAQRYSYTTVKSNKTPEGEKKKPAKKSYQYVIRY